MHFSVTSKTKRLKRNLQYLQLLAKSHFQLTSTNKNDRSIITGINIEDIRSRLERTEELFKQTNFTEGKMLRDYINYNLPRICGYIYDSSKPSVQLGKYLKQLLAVYYNTLNFIELNSLVISVEKIYLLRKLNEYIIVPYDTPISQEHIAKLYLGRDVIARYRKDNSICIGKVLYSGKYFNASNPVYEVELYNVETEDSSLNSTNLEDYTVLMDIPVLKKIVSPKVK